MRRRLAAAALLAALALGLLSLPVRAQDAAQDASQDAARGDTPGDADAGVPTTVVVRAISQDGKVIYDSVGGARITLRDAATGAVLAEGVQAGGSGDTDRIMRQPHARGADVYATEGAAKFEAVLRLRQPTRVEVTAEGPLAYPQATQRATKTLWLVPGEDVTGNGVVLTLHGFIVEILAPDAPAAAASVTPGAAVTPGSAVPVRARVRMTCGCPTRPGGLWDADRFTIAAQLVAASGAVVATTPLAYAGETSTYAGTLTAPPGGPPPVAVRVTATDAARANLGVATRPLASPAAPSSGSSSGSSSGR